VQEQELKRVKENVNRFSGGFFSDLIKKIANAEKNPTQMKSEKESVSAVASDQVAEKPKASGSAQPSKKSEPIVVAPGTAEAVSYEADPTRPDSFRAPSTGEGGAEEVHFSR
jgi:hypothetical protein